MKNCSILHGRFFVMTGLIISLQEARNLKYLNLSHNEFRETGGELIGDALNWPRGYKTFFMLNSAELEVYPANKC